MKRIILSIITILLSLLHLNAQNNTFPANGKVGIGTVNPSVELEVIGNLITKSANGSQAYMRISGGGNIGTINWYNTSSQRVAYMGWGNSGVNELNLSLENSSKFVINGGNVGIGTFNPNYTLDVNGTINASMILINGQSISNTASLWTASNSDLYFSGGNVGIGTENTFGYKLAVNGTIGSTEVKVENTSAWPDFVFNKDYKLRTLEEVKRYIDEKGHLPEIPSEEEVTENGIILGEMNVKLLQKIEELTLYLIEQNKQNQAQQARIEQLEKELKALKHK